MRIPKKPYLHRTVFQEKGGTWTAFRYVLVATTGSKTKKAALSRLLKIQSEMGG
jgi:hypothetical protein